MTEGGVEHSTPILEVWGSNHSLNNAFSTSIVILKFQKLTTGGGVLTTVLLNMEYLNKFFLEIVYLKLTDQGLKGLQMPMTLLPSNTVAQLICNDLGSRLSY